jgi:SAM-dependent methyltransferase
MGVEIGAFQSPIPGIQPIYVDRFAEYAGQPTLADFYGDACALPFGESSVDYVASSHVIEHVANPVAALREWYRVLSHGGIIYCCVPHRRRTFDRTRALTEPGHLWTDYRNGVTQVDGTHIDDFCFGVDWELFSPGSPADRHVPERIELAARYRASIAAKLEINIHFHTFEPGSFRALLALCHLRRVWPGRIEVCEEHDEFPSENPIGFLVVLKVRKTLRERWRARSVPAGVLPSARRFLPRG